MFFDLASAVRSRIGPSNLPSKFFGSQRWLPVCSASSTTGSSGMMVAAVNPFSSYAE